MEQRSVLIQATRPEAKRLLTDQWMKLFFAEDTPENRPIVELQRRAVWIGLAFILQALNEIDHNWYIPYLMPVGSLIPFVLILGSFYAMWRAIRPARPQQAKQPAQYPARWQRIILTLTLILTIAGGIELGRGLMMCFLPPQFSNDGTSLDTNAAILLIEGRNPYTESNMLDLARRFPIQPNWTTPLRVGQFANRFDYPTMVEFQTVLDTDLKAGIAPEFESKVSYPALSFLTLLPFALFKDYNVLPFYMLSYAALVVVAWRTAHPALRPWVLLLTMANIPMWSSTVGGNLDIFYTLLIALVWLLRDHRWHSAIFLGLALASKQIAWFFIPFYLIMIYRQYGIKETLYRLTIAGSIGLAINLPFILWNPHAWLAGVLAPVADLMFPMGVGIVNLSITHLLPFFPQWVYSALEGVALLLSLAWYWRLCQKAPEAAMLLAVVPLFFAWRSLPSYFYCSAFPIFMMLIAKIRPSPRPAMATAGQSHMRKRVGLLAPVGV